jgi:hypothetical protein
MSLSPSYVLQTERDHSSWVPDTTFYQRPTFQVDDPDAPNPDTLSAWSNSQFRVDASSQRKFRKSFLN